MKPIEFPAPHSNASERGSCLIDLSDRETLSHAIDEALTEHCFCQPERALIVQIVCDTILSSAEGQLAATANR